MDILSKKISKYDSTSKVDMASITYEELSLMYKKVHRDIVNSLIYTYIRDKFRDSSAIEFGFFIEDFEETEIHDIPLDLEIDEIPFLCEQLHIDYLNSEVCIHKGKLTKKKSKKNLLEMGAVYTPKVLAASITRRTLKELDIKTLEELKILDFATGTGRFYGQIVRCCEDLWNLDPDSSIPNNIYAIDIDPIAINICRLNAFSCLKVKSIANLIKISEHIICRNVLIDGGSHPSFLDTIKHDTFPYAFDAIVSNPPYLVLKPNRSKMDASTVKDIMEMANYFRSSGNYLYSIEGMLNLYQISLEAIINMLKDGGQLGVICPSTLFADISATKLRKYFLSKHGVSYIKYFSEDEQLFFNVTQATCVFHLKKNGITDIITIEQGDKSYKICLDDVKALMPMNWEIPSIDMIEWKILKKLSKVPKLKQRTNIRNRRGELDLSMFKEFITENVTPYRLVRGNMISESGIKDVNHEHVLPSFLKHKTSDFIEKDFGRERLVCQQISNQSQKIRLHFVLCESSDILGNSCNYISVETCDIAPMMALLNSALLNWRFKITSTNNHINNYELGELPVIDTSLLDESIMLLDKEQRDKKICQLYGLDALETKRILSGTYETI